MGSEKAYRGTSRQPGPDSAELALSSAVKTMRRSGALPVDAVAGIAHELPNPLNAILGFTEIMRKEKFGPHGDPRYLEYSEIVHTAAHKLLRICNRLIDEDLAEAVPPPLDPEPISAVAVISSIVELYSATAHERGVDIRMSIDDGFPKLKVDGDLLESVLGDLVSNAIKFTPSGGRVTLHARRSDDGDSAILVISDTGVGMTPETLVRVMRLLPVKPETGPHGDTGNGLGLGLVKARLASLGIQLELRSSVNAGTAVVLTFPGSLTDPH